MSVRHVRVDGPLSDGDEKTLIDVLVNHDADDTRDKLEYNESLKIEINRTLKFLTDRQKDVISYFYGIGVDHALSLEDIGNRYSLTRERVRQIKDKALLKLRSTQTCNELRLYLG